MACSHLSRHSSTNQSDQRSNAHGGGRLNEGATTCQAEVQIRYLKCGLWKHLSYLAMNFTFMNWFFRGDSMKVSLFVRVPNLTFLCVKWKKVTGGNPTLTSLNLQIHHLFPGNGWLVKTSSPSLLAFGRWPKTAGFFGTSGQQQTVQRDSFWIQPLLGNKFFELQKKMLCHKWQTRRNDSVMTYSKTRFV